MSEEKRYRDLVEAYQKPYPEMVKQKLSQESLAEWNRVKKSPEDYEKSILTLKLALAFKKINNENQQHYLGRSISNQKEKVNDPLKISVIF